MKYAIYGVCGFFFFLYMFGPAIFDAMKKKDYNDLYDGLKQTRIDNGSYHDGPRYYESYEEKLMKRK